MATTNVLRATACSIAVLFAACGGPIASTDLSTPPLGTAGAAEPVESSSAIQHTLGNTTFAASNVNGSGTIPVFAATPVVSAHPGVTRVVVIVHGETRDAGTYYNDVAAAQGKAGSTAASAYIVAPQFLNTTDVTDTHNAATLPSTTIGWSVDEYSDGKDAKFPAAISAFDVLDDLVAAFTNRTNYPNLQTIVLAGHSGGAQLVGRYAIVGGTFTAAAAAGYNVQFVIASPSSWLYFDTNRPQRGGFGPGNVTACAAFNSWRYGFDGAPRYVGAPGITARWQQFTGLNLTFLSGSLDTVPDGSIDQSCGAEDEGHQRLSRADNYYAYLASRNGGTPIGTKHTVQGVGHNDYDMLTSSQAVTALFGS